MFKYINTELTNWSKNRERKINKQVSPTQPWSAVFPSVASQGYKQHISVNTVLSWYLMKK